MRLVVRINVTRRMVTLTKLDVFADYSVYHRRVLTRIISIRLPLSTRRLPHIRPGDNAAESSWLTLDFCWWNVTFL